MPWSASNNAGMKTSPGRPLLPRNAVAIDLRNASSGRGYTVTMAASPPAEGAIHGTFVAYSLAQRTQTLEGESASRFRATFKSQNRVSRFGLETTLIQMADDIARVFRCSWQI